MHCLAGQVSQRAGFSEVLLAPADKSADAGASSRPPSVELVPAVGLGYHSDVGEHVLRVPAQRLVIREHLHPEQGLLGVGAEFIGSDAYRVGVFRWWLFVLAEPEVDQAAAIVDQRAGVDGVGVEPFLPELLAARELVTPVGGALLKRQGDPRTEKGPEDGWVRGRSRRTRPGGHQWGQSLLDNSRCG